MVVRSIDLLLDSFAPKNEGTEKQDEEDHKQGLSHPGCGPGDWAEPEPGREDSGYQKY